MVQSTDSRGLTKDGIVELRQKLIPYFDNITEIRWLPSTAYFVFYLEEKSFYVQPSHLTAYMYTNEVNVTSVPALLSILEKYFDIEIHINWQVIHD